MSIDRPIGGRYRSIEGVFFFPAFFLYILNTVIQVELKLYEQLRNVSSYEVPPQCLKSIFGLEEASPLILHLSAGPEWKSIWMNNFIIDSNAVCRKL